MPSRAKMMFRNVLENCKTMQRTKKLLKVKVNVIVKVNVVDIP